MAGIETLAKSLNAEGRDTEALLLFEHLAAIGSRDEAILLPLVKLLGAQGRTLQAIEKLVELRTVSTDAEILLGEIKTQMGPAIERFNAHLSAGEIEQAEHYASALAGLVPRNVALLDAVFACNVALGRKEKATAYAAALLAQNSSHAAAQAYLSGDHAESKPAEQSETPQAHPLLRLRDLHDSISAILCRKLTADGIAQVEQHLNASRALVIDVPENSEWEGWVKHYRLALDAIDLAAVQRPTPKRPNAPIEQAVTAVEPAQVAEL